MAMTRILSPGIAVALVLATVSTQGQTAPPTPTPAPAPAPRLQSPPSKSFPGASPTGSV